jgi:hypothetical protein
MPKGYAQDGTPLGGKRSGSGRKPAQDERTTPKTVRLTPAELEYLATISPNLSQAIRTLVNRSR